MSSLNKKFILFFVLLFGIIFYNISFAAVSCSVAPTCAGGTVLLKLASTTGSHAELPSQSNYSNLVCCTGVATLSNSCTGNQKTFLKISGNTNAHAQTPATNTYGTNACVSDTDLGSTITVGTQATNCTGYDTTIASISNTDNAHVGDSSAYTTKVCLRIVPQAISFALSNNSVGFGSLSAASPRYANAAGTGSGSEVEAHTISASTNGTGGYVVTLNGATLTSGSNTITAIGSTNTASSSGTEQFGIRSNINSGTGTVSTPYAAAGFAYDTASMPDILATGLSDGVTTQYSLRYISNISSITEAGSYSTNITYVMTATY